MQRMPDIRKIVLDRMKDRELTQSRIADLLKDRIAKRAIHDFLNGTTNLNSKALGYLFDLLDLTIKPK